MGKMLKIMLAQDTDTQTGCAAALRSSGFEVETVRKDGAQILRLFRQGSRPDVLIMDAFMQGTDAIGVLGGLADMRLEPRPLVFVTASNANPRLEQEITQNGADYYFIKPFDTQMLIQRIKQLSGLSAPAQGNIVSFSSSDNSLEVTVSEIMHRIGVPAHKGLSVSARGDYTRGQRRRDNEFRHEAALSHGRKDLQNNSVARRACHPSRHRGRLGQGRRRCAQLLLRLHHTELPRQAD